MDHENGNSALAYNLVQSSDDDVGRHLVASRDLNPGDIVLTERPLVFGPKAMLDPEVAMPCAGCYQPVFTESGERCTMCGWPVCSGNCPGLKDPRHHGAECKILSLRPECVLKNMADYYREANEFIVEYLINNFINKMDEKLRKSYEITSELLHRICGIIDTNALEIRLPQGTELSALYAVTCKMEHSCMPNTKHTSFAFNPKDRKDLYEITIKAVVPIIKNYHIATMYSHALWGTQARRQHLKDSKYFACKCPRCSDPTELGTYLSAMKCLGDENKPCDGIHLPEDPLDDETDWVCSKCPVRVSSSQVNMIMSQMGEDVEAVLMMDGSVTILENLLCRLTMFLHPNHYYMYSLKHSLVQLYGREQGYTSMDILDKKIKMCRELISVTKALDPGNARLSLYNTVLQHELHSALVMKCKNMVVSKTEDIKPLLVEAKLAIEDALKSVKDDLEEVSGKRLQSVLDDSRREFDKFCKQKKIVV
ncbi:unnamed protein product [Spodoptera littoralis]|uniref:Protein msta n=1 Tax=Spodoptera littoralis TaxID=7109 RepID=A0A9P0I3U7_SPOLI|nr:unnamed protein product [Spodoptera littoralis]CAH1639287.1 unnamed protein product [Spodoptera littoralis]